MMIPITLIRIVLMLTRVEVHINAMVLIIRISVLIATVGRSSFVMEVNGVVIKTGISMVNVPMTTMLVNAMMSIVLRDGCAEMIKPGRALTLAVTLIITGVSVLTRNAWKVGTVMDSSGSMTTTLKPMCVCVVA